MSKPLHFNRRLFLGSAAGAATLAAMGGSASALAQAAGPASPRLPARGNYVLRNGYVMTMDTRVNDIANADVHVRNGEIIAVGTKLNAPGAQAIDARGMIVLPGFIETHWHMWNTLARSMAGDKREHGYFPTSTALGRAFRAEDMYIGTRLAAAEAIFGGITYVHDWCHNIRSPEYAEANLRALREAGVRGRFSYGTPQGHPASETINLTDLERLHRNWDKYSNDDLLGLGLAWRGAFDNPKDMTPNAMAKREFDTARRLRIPISIHVSNSKARSGQIAKLAEGNYLGSDVQLIHAIWFTPEEMKAVVQAGSTISLSPYTELRIGFGFPKTGEIIAAGALVGLSVDTIALSGNADMFAIMKVIQNVENALSENEFKITARRVLELATIEGARSMGISDRVGSLEPGKRADIIMVSTRALNMGPFIEASHQIVEAAQPFNVDTVMIDGRILKRGGKLTHLNTQRILGDASIAIAAVRKRANWW